MSLRDKPKQLATSLRKLRLSLGPDSYFQYKRARNSEQTQVDDAHQHAQESAERDRAEAARDAQRESEYDERYTRERERDTARERADDSDPDR
jgi:hypothetical protein